MKDRDGARGARRALLAIALALSLPAAALDPPDVAIATSTDGDSVYVHLTWPLVPGAAAFKIFHRATLAGEALQQALVLAPPYQCTVPTGWSDQSRPDILGFYQVVSTNIEPDNLLSVPAGSFGMSWGAGFLVTLTHPFAIASTEVSNWEFVVAAQWALDNGLATIEAGNLVAQGQPLLELASPYSEISFVEGRLGLMRAVGAGDWGFDDSSYDPAYHPIKRLNWFGAACFCDWLSLMTGLPPYYLGLWSQIPSGRNPYAATGYRLPTEAEWEFVAQFDDERAYPWGPATHSCERANYCNSGSYCVGWSSPVGSHPAGASSLGLQDLAGNVWEWCNDWYATYNAVPQTDPVGPPGGAARVVRGGNWEAPQGASALQCAYRGFYAPATFNNGVGFRICRTLPQ